MDSDWCLGLEWIESDEFNMSKSQLFQTIPNQSEVRIFRIENTVWTNPKLNWLGLIRLDSYWNLASIGSDSFILVPQIDFCLTFIKGDIKPQFRASIRMNPKQCQLIRIDFLIRFNLDHFRPRINLNWLG